MYNLVSSYARIRLCEFETIATSGIIAPNAATNKLIIFNERTSLMQATLPVQCSLAELFHSRNVDNCGFEDTV